MNEWGIDMTFGSLSAIEGMQPSPSPSPIEIYLLQRKSSKFGKGLGKTNGWAHRAGLLSKDVSMLAGVEYLKNDDAGLHNKVNDKVQILDVDNVIVCAGLAPIRELVDG